jgi:hypothetical protein
MPLISNNGFFDLGEIADALNDSEEISAIQELKELNALEEKKKELSGISRILNRKNGSIEEASGVITDIMHSSKFDNTRIKAAEIVLDLHEVRNKDGQVNKQPIINFNIISDEVQIGNIFNPNRG